jgi:glycosyltransferase involved in cell wall biosynthesis
MRTPARVMILLGSIFPEHMDLWRACSQAGVDISVVGTMFNPYKGRLPWTPKVPSDLDCKLLEPVRLQRKGLHTKWWYPGLGGVLRAARPDIVHVHSEPWGLLVIECEILRSLGRADMRLCAHGADNIYHHGNTVQRFARRTILRGIEPRLDGFVSWNSAGLDLARSTGLPTSTPSAVVPGIVPDPDRLAPPSSQRRRDLRANLDLPQDDVVVGFVGKLTPAKGVLDAIEAVGRLDSGAPFLAIWGAGPLGRQVDAAMSQRSVRGTFGGMLDLSDVPDALRACDIVVVPSRTVPHWAEQFGRIVVEAMLAGCAVIAYRSGSLAETVADGGLLVDEGDVTGLSTAIEKLTRDPSYRDEIAAGGRRSALARFHPRLLAERLIAFWDEVLQR